MDKSPDAFRTISEAADELDLPQHVLRFWETRFGQIKPLKRGGGRRYYRPDDVQLLKGIRHLLYDQGFTIKGVQRILKEQGVRHVVAIGETGSIVPIAPQMPGEAEEQVQGVEFVEVETEPYALPEPPVAPAPVQAEPRPAGLSDEQRGQLGDALNTLLDCKRMLDKARGV